MNAYVLFWNVEDASSVNRLALMSSFLRSGFCDNKLGSNSSKRFFPRLRSTWKYETIDTFYEVAREVEIIQGVLTAFRRMSTRSRTGIKS